MKTLRVLHIISTYFPAMRYGGPVRSVQGLCKALVDRGHEVHVFTTNVDGDHVSNVPLRSPVDLEGVKIWYFPTKKWTRRLFWSPEMMTYLKREIATFDLVHLHSVFFVAHECRGPARSRSWCPLCSVSQGHAGPEPDTEP